MKIIDYARSKDPEFSFTTDLIVGFPSETYEEFCETKELIKKVKYDNIYSLCIQDEAAQRLPKWRITSQINRRVCG